MIHVVNSKNRRQYSDYLEQMHKLRHEIYVEQREWKNLGGYAGLEIDEYDTANATYLLAISSEGKLQGSVRLLPTAVPTLIGDHFSHTITNGTLENSMDCWEISRYFVNDRYGQDKDGHPVRRQLILSMLEFAVENEISSLVVIADTFFLPMVAKMPWKVDYLGLPVQYEEGECIPVKIHVDESMYRLTQKVTGYTKSGLVRDAAFVSSQNDFTSEKALIRGALENSWNRDMLNELKLLLPKLSTNDPYKLAEAESELDKMIEEARLMKATTSIAQKGVSTRSKPGPVSNKPTIN